LASLDAADTAKRQQLERIIDYMQRRRLPTYFQKIILDFYDYYTSSQDDGMLKELPPAIQGRLSLLLNRELVKNIPLLKSLELNTIIAMMQTLQHRMLMPGEYIFRHGEKGEHMFFVKKGQCAPLPLAARDACPPLPRLCSSGTIHLSELCAPRDVGPCRDGILLQALILPLSPRMCPPRRVRGASAQGA
jgi:hypothetical protein